MPEKQRLQHSRIPCQVQETQSVAVETTALCVSLQNTPKHGIVKMASMLKRVFCCTSTQRQGREGSAATSATANQLRRSPAMGMGSAS